MLLVYRHLTVNKNGHMIMNKSIRLITKHNTQLLLRCRKIHNGANGSHKMDIHCSRNITDIPDTKNITG